MAGGTKTQQAPAAKPAAPKPAVPKLAPAAQSPAQTVQQRAGNQGAGTAMQKKGAGGAKQGAKKGAGLPESSELVDLSSGTFNPTQKVQDEIKASPKGLMVRIAAKGVADEGRVKIKANSKGDFYSVDRGSMPMLGEWAQVLGGLYLNVAIATSGQVTGNASLKPESGPSKDWLKVLQDNAALLGGAGLKIDNLPTPVNKFENGKLTLGVNKFKVEVGGFVTSEFNIQSVNGAKPTVDASAKVKIGGAAEGELAISNATGPLQGQVSLAVTFAAFSGSVLVKYNPEGTVDIGGKAAYNADKLSGEIEFIATDVDAANKFAKDAIAAAGGLENVQQAPGAPPVPAPQPDKKKRALAASGILTFNLTQWFAGTVTVVVDGKGQVTVIGKIAPPAEIELFSQKDWDKELFKLEAKAYYGIPVVGNLNLFANISLHAIAKLGPAKIYKIEVLGTYSTDPEVQKNIQIAGSINISAYAGLRLRAEGGAGIEILDHDLKFGIGVNADVGVKAYAEARPTLGFREPGEFYISGTLEMVAQPMLGLSGDFFIEIDTPWWSPLSDDKWTWPLFSKEWPLTDPIGINASIKDYVLGSGKVPEIELKPPEFDPSKFMTNMVDDKLPGKSGKGDKGSGTFKEDGSVQKPVVPDKKKDDGKNKKGKGDKKQGKGQGKSGKKDAQADASQSAAKDLKKGLDALKGKEPYSKPELDKALGALKKKVSGVSFNQKLEGENWKVTAGGGKKKKSAGQSITLKAKKDAAASDESTKALAALDQVVQGYMAKGATLEEMTSAVKSVRRKFKFKSLTVTQDGGFWYLDYEINPKGKKKGPKTVGAAGTGTDAGPVAESDAYKDTSGASHTLNLTTANDTAKITITPPAEPVRQYLDEYPDKTKAAWKMANSVFIDAMKVIFTYAKKDNKEKDRRKKIKKELAKVSAAFAKLAGGPPAAADYGPNTAPTYGNPAKVEVEVIHTKPKQGTKTGPWPETRKGYKEIYKAGLTVATDPWVQMHIVSEKLGGSGTDFDNLVPAPQSVNTGPFRSFEHSVASLVAAKSGTVKNRVWVEVSVNGTKTAATGLKGTAGLYFWKGESASPKWLKNETASFSASVGIPVPQLGAARKLVLNYTSGTEMRRDFGISSATATLVKEGRFYKSIPDFVDSMTKRGATKNQIDAILKRGPVLDGQ